jgi:putative transcriptional regulator
MIIKAGSFLKSTNALDNSDFEDVLVFIMEHNQNGATGFVLNKLFNRVLNELEEFSASMRFKLYNGGPVDTEHIFFLHRRPDVINNGTHIFNDVYFGGDFKQAVTGINNKAITENDLSYSLVIVDGMVAN